MRHTAVLGFAVVLLLAGCGAPASTDSAAAPSSGDVLGWEDGYWHNATLSVDATDGLTADERAAVVARAKARVEYLRGLEFEGDVGITVRSRSNFSAGGGNVSAALRRFDNVKFAALFLVGTETDSMATQSDSLNASVGGYYSPGQEDIVLVSDAAMPTLESERTLAHELVHALQDQHFNLSRLPEAESRDAHNGRNGLIEGDPTAVEQAYMARCGAEWSCVEGGQGGGGAGSGSSPHLGVYLLQFFPYSDGPAFVDALGGDGDWAAVNAAYEHPPDSAVEVIDPTRYPDFEPRAVDLDNELRNGWERVRPPDRPDHATLGQSALTAAFGYTLYDDYNDSSVVSAAELLNLGPGGALDDRDPIQYDLPPVRGWTGDRLHVYHRGSETAYRWRLTWDSPAAGERFAEAYRDLLAHWGGSATPDGPWRLPQESPFTGVYHIDQAGDTVTIAHADDLEALAAVSPTAR